MGYTLVPPGTAAPEDTPPGGYTLVPPQTPIVSNPVDEMNPFTRFLAGYGGEVANLGLGARKLAALGGMGDVNAVNREAEQKKALDANLNNTTAGTLGRISADVVTGLPAVMAAPGVLGAGAVGALFGALEPTTAEDSVAVNTIKGGLLGMGGQAVADAFGSILRGVKPSTEQIAAAKDFADKWGGTLSRGQLAGSEILQRIERMAGAVGSKFSQNANDANASALGKAIMSHTEGDAGQLIQRAGAGKQFIADAPFVSDVRSIPDKFAGLVDKMTPNSPLSVVDQYVGSPNPALRAFKPDQQAKMIAQGVPEFVTESGAPAKLAEGSTMPMVGPIHDFNNYQSIRSLLGTRAYGGGDPAAKSAYALLQDAFDENAMRSLAKQGADPMAIDTARKAYALQRIVRPAANIDETGAIVGYDPQKLARAVEATDRNSPGMIDRLGEPGKMLRQAVAFAKVAKPVNSSGTAENAIAGKVAGLEVLKDALDSLIHGGNVVGAVAQGTLPLVGMLHAPKIVNAIMQGTRNGILPDMGRAATRAGDYVGALGTSAARGAITLRDLLGQALLPSPSGSQ